MANLDFVVKNGLQVRSNVVVGDFVYSVTPVSNSIIVSGSVGVGTSRLTENAKLDIVGGNIKVASEGFGVVFPDGTFQTTAVTATPPGGTTGSIQYNNNGVFGGDVNKFSISANGNVGIGTSTVESGILFQVDGNVKIKGTGNGIYFPDGTFIDSIQLTNNYVSKSFTYTGNGSTTEFSTNPITSSDIQNTMVFINGVYQRKNTYSWTGYTITFNVAPVNKALIEINAVQSASAPLTISDITASGNIVASGNIHQFSGRMGIGTSSTAGILSGNTLTVFGNVNLVGSDGSYLLNGTPLVSGAIMTDNNSTNADTYYPVMSINQTSGQLQNVISSSSKLYFNPSTGAFHSGSFIPSDSTTPTVGMFAPAANTIAISTSTTERLRIDSNGNVGINTNNSTNALTVFGSGSISTTTGAIVANGGIGISGDAHLGGNIYLDTSNKGIVFFDNTHLTTLPVTTFSGGSTGLTPSTGTAGAVTLSGVLNAVTGGTGQNVYVVGDMLYASSTTELSRLADVATGNVLLSGGEGVAPSWGKIDLNTHVGGTLSPQYGGTGLNSFVAGDLLYADDIDSIAKLADVATGNVLLSGGVGAAPSYGKVGLTTHVDGTLAATNGGTGFNSYTTGDLLFASNSTTISNLSIAPSGNVLISGANPSWNKVGLTTHVSGILPLANGGTNAALSASNGGMVYSTATELAVLSASATSGNVLISGGAGTPSWGLYYTSSEVPNSIVSRDATGSFSANGITASNGIVVTNNGLNVTGDGTITGNLSVTGNLILNGNVTVLESNVLVVNDPIIYIAENNPANTIDMGLVGSYTDGTYKHTGFVRNHTTGVWTVFDNLVTEPSETINWTQDGLAFGAVKVGTLNAASTTASTNTTTGAIVTSGGVGVSGNLNVGGTIYAAGNVSTDGNVIVAGKLTVTGPISSDNSITAGSTIAATGNISTDSNINASGTIFSTGNITTDSNVNASGTIYSTGNITTDSNINALGSIITSAELSATGNISSLGTTTSTGFIPTGIDPVVNGMFSPDVNAIGFSTNSVEQVRITSTGNVGIGTNLNLSHKLVLSSGNLFINTSGKGIIFPDGTFQPTAAANTPPGGSTGAIQYQDSTGNFAGDSSNFYYDPNLARVGIGTNDTSTFTMNIVGDAPMLFDTRSSNNPTFILGNSATTGAVFGYNLNQNYGYIKYNPNVNDMIRWSSTGVSINGVNPINGLDVSGALAVGGIQYAGTATAPQYGMIVQGNVGIGTTDASSKLTVFGDGNIFSPTASVSYTTGAFVVQGGVGIGGNLYVGGTNSDFFGDVKVNGEFNVTESIHSNTTISATNLTSSGNVDIAGNLNVTNNCSFTNDVTILGNLNLGDTTVSSELVVFGTDNNLFSGNVGIGTSSLAGIETGNVLTLYGNVHIDETSAGIFFPDGTFINGLSSLSSYNSFYYSYTGDGITTAYSVAPVVAGPGGLANSMIYVNGVYQRKSTYTWIGNTITFDSAPDEYALIEINVVDTAGENGPINAYQQFAYTYTGDGVTTIYSTAPAIASSVNNTMVYVNGVYQRKSTYTWVDTSLTFSEAPDEYALIEINVVDSVTTEIATVNANINVSTVTVTSGNSSIGTGTGAIICTGGVGIGGNINVGGTINTFTGNVGIGTSTPAYKIDVYGSGHVSGNLTVGNTVSAQDFDNVSDITFKENIEGIVDPLSIIKQLNPVTFNWKNNKSKAFGLIAQEVEKVAPDIVHEKEGGIKTISYNQIIPLLISIIKEQQDQIDSINAKLPTKRKSKK